MLKENHLIEKRNVLNEMRMSSMSLQEVRFFAIYLSKINARNTDTREVFINLDDFCEIMDFKQMNPVQISKTTDLLLNKIVTIPLDEGGFAKFQLFKCCELRKDENHNWVVYINVHDEALGLMFDFKDKYFTYELWNALSLSSVNQIRFYELLKQYEKIGSRTLHIKELKLMLGMDEQEYPRWSDFKKRVIDPCQEALKKNTDICFLYEPIRTHRKFSKITFIIQKNNNHVDLLALQSFLAPQLVEEATPKEEAYPKIYTLFSDALNNEFDMDEIDLIFNMIRLRELHGNTGNIDLTRYRYLKEKYSQMNLQGKNTTIKNRFSYFLKMIQSDE